MNGIVGSLNIHCEKAYLGDVSKSCLTQMTNQRLFFIINIQKSAFQHIIWYLLMSESLKQKGTKN